jgi:hypothetical protein
LNLIQPSHAVKSDASKSSAVRGGEHREATPILLRSSFGSSTAVEFPDVPEIVQTYAARLLDCHSLIKTVADDSQEGSPPHKLHILRISELHICGARLDSVPAFEGTTA